MQPKTIRILYWIITPLFALAMFVSGIVNFLHTQQSLDIMQHLGYPVYVLTILGVAKILGSLALLQGKFRSLTEWAYAGFTIDIIGATASMLFSGDPLTLALSPIIFLTVLFFSYFLWKAKLRHTAR